MTIAPDRDALASMAGQEEIQALLVEVKPLVVTERQCG